MPTKKGGERGWNMKFGVLQIIWKETERLEGKEVDVSLHKYMKFSRIKYIEKFSIKLYKRILKKNCQE